MSFKRVCPPLKPAPQVQLVTNELKTVIFKQLCPFFVKNSLAGEKNCPFHHLYTENNLLKSTFTQCDILSQSRLNIFLFVCLFVCVGASALSVAKSQYVFINEYFFW